MVGKGIGKATIAALALILVMMFANTAFGKSDDMSKANVAGSSSIDVKIVERSKSCNCCAKHTSENIDAVSSVKETISDLAPGNSVVLEYKIVNTGCMDVLLDGVYITVDNQKLQNYIHLQWVITEYHDSTPVNTISGSEKNKCLSFTSEPTDTSLKGIVLETKSTKDDYCILELTITYSENSPETSEALQTTFTITPSFIQN